VQDLDNLALVEDLSFPWCNSNAATTSVMEAISFVTPVLENFVICTVAEGLAGKPNSQIYLRCRAFIREESNHSRVHKKFNASLLKYLGMSPPGLALVQSLLNAARKHLSLFSRLLLVAALEHFAAALSKGYLRQETGWDFRSASAKELFAQHAREELAHRAVAFDLWLSNGTTGRVGRTVTVLAIMVAGFAYVSAAVPWIIYRKTGKHLSNTLIALANCVLRTCLHIESYSILGELFSFARGDYHPDRVIDKNAADEMK
jgi:predicted metal-dependent hydrolase